MSSWMYYSYRYVNFIIVLFFRCLSTSFSVNGTIVWGILGLGWMLLLFRSFALPLNVCYLPNLWVTPTFTCAVCLVFYNLILIKHSPIILYGNLFLMNQEEDREVDSTTGTTEKSEVSRKWWFLEKGKGVWQYIWLIDWFSILLYMYREIISDKN